MTTAEPNLADEHSVLLWQTCSYADALVTAATSGGPLGTPYDAMLGFLHYRLLPYLSSEERALLPSERALIGDHNRIRGDVEDLDLARTRRTLATTSAALVRRLDEHVQREDALGVTGPGGGRPPAAWALPLLLTDEIDLTALPPDSAAPLVLARLRRMRNGETVLLHGDYDLHVVWRRLHAVAPGDHAWSYDRTGPDRWTARVTRRDLEVD